MITIIHKRVDKEGDKAKFEVDPFKGYKFITSLQLLPGEEKMRFFIENFDKITEEDLRKIVFNSFPLKG